MTTTTTTTTTEKLAISFGAANVGKPKDETKWKGLLGETKSLVGDDFKTILNYLVKNEIYDIDTAYMYGFGASEEELGTTVPTISVPSGVKWTLATKAHPSYGWTSKEVQEQLNTSLKRLQVKSIDIFYLHFPDSKVNLEDTLEGVNVLYKEGKFKELGLSNFLAFQIAQVFYISKAKGWVLPTVYQGPYSLLARKAEDEIFLALDMFKMRFYAYSPLAAGLLAKPLASFDKVPDDSRFAGGSLFAQLYWKKELFTFLEKVNEEAKKHDLSILQVALAWLVHHSKLNAKRGDKVILGASSLKQLETSVTELRAAKPLPSSLLDVIKAGSQGVDASPTPQIVQPVEKL